MQEKIPLFKKYSLHNLPVNSNELLEAVFTKKRLYSIRLNETKLNCKKIDFKPVMWSEHSYYLPEKLNFTFDPWWHAGAYYVQEASSMFIDYILRNTISPSSKKVLDLCAAPGGKSILLSSYFDTNSVVIANEIIKSRVHTLKENIIKWGKGNVLVTNNNSKDFGSLINYFDVILADVPCSGEGLFRKDKNALKHWTPKNVDFCAMRQRKIIKEIWPSLKEDGILIYSTCTYNTIENEENIQWLTQQVDAECIELSLPSEWKIITHRKNGVIFYRFFPHLTEGEGFSVAIIRKKSPVKHKPKSNSKQIFKQIKLKENKNFNVNQSFTYDFHDKLIISHLSSEYWKELILRLNVMYIFTEAGQWKKQDFVPSHALATSLWLPNFSYPKHNVNYEEAIKFFKKENISSEKFQTGWNVLAFKGLSIGFVKKHSISSINNYYPKEWRILSKNIPLEEDKLLFFKI